MIVTFYQRKHRPGREERSVEDVFSPSSPFLTPPPPVLVSSLSCRYSSSRSEWQKRKESVARMAVLCGNLKRRRQQPYNPALEQPTCDSDSDGDFYYFYPHKVKDRSNSVGESNKCGCVTIRIVLFSVAVNTDRTAKYGFRSRSHADTSTITSSSSSSKILKLGCVACWTTTTTTELIEACTHSNLNRLFALCG